MVNNKIPPETEEGEYEKYLDRIRTSKTYQFGFREGFQAGQKQEREDELDFLNKIISYCDEMHFNVGKSILDDFNIQIKSRKSKLSQKEEGKGE